MSGSPRSNRDALLRAALSDFRDWLAEQREKPSDEDCTRALCAAALRALAEGPSPAMSPRRNKQPGYTEAFYTSCDLKAGEPLRESWTRGGPHYEYAVSRLRDGVGIPAGYTLARDYPEGRRIDKADIVIALVPREART